MQEPALAPGLATEARRQDPDRWLCTLFAPAALRDEAMALLLLNHELARIPELVSQPVAGMIRYQWWRDAIDGAAEGEPRAQPVVEALSRSLRAGRLDRAELLAMVEAREHDLDRLAPEDPAALEAYAEATAGAVQAAMARLLGAEATGIVAARSIGTAWGLIGIIRATAHLAQQGRSLLPTSLTEAVGVEPNVVLTAESREAVADVLRRLGERATAILDRPRPALPRHAVAAVLPAVLARLYLGRIAAMGFDPVAAATLTRPPLAPLRLWWAYRRAPAAEAATSTGSAR
jgi:phytoene synthase